LEILPLKPLWNSNALLAIAVGSGIAGSLDLAQACILSAGRIPLVIAAGLPDGRTMRNERFAGKCLNRILKLDFYRTLRIAPTGFCPLSAPDVEVARKLIECCEKASPAGRGWIRRRATSSTTPPRHKKSKKHLNAQI
jgi:hypothetical protein